MGIVIIFRQEVGQFYLGENRVGQFYVGTHGAGHIHVGEVGHLVIGVDTLFVPDGRTLILHASSSSFG